jgi:hypothetical protein
MGLKAAYRVARQGQPDGAFLIRPLLPIAAFMVGFVLVSLRLYLG